MLLTAFEDCIGYVAWSAERPFTSLPRCTGQRSLCCCQQLVGKQDRGLPGFLGSALHTAHSCTGRTRGLLRHGQNRAQHRSNCFLDLRRTDLFLSLLIPTPLPRRSNTLRSIQAEPLTRASGELTERLFDNILVERGSEMTLRKLTEVVGVAPRQVRYMIAEGFVPPPVGGRAHASYGEEHVAAIQRVHAPSEPRIHPCVDTGSAAGPGRRAVPGGARDHARRRSGTHRIGRARRTLVAANRVSPWGDSEQTWRG